MEETLNLELLHGETNAEFNTRTDKEDAEAMTVACPLSSCEAEIRERCCSESGIRRSRHFRRLMLARKNNE